MTAQYTVTDFYGWGMVLELYQDGFSDFQMLTSLDGANYQTSESFTSGLDVYIRVNENDDFIFNIGPPIPGGHWIVGAGLPDALYFGDGAVFDIASPSPNPIPEPTGAALLASLGLWMLRPSRKGRSPLPVTASPSRSCSGAA
ncbi:MAG: hypothetical protein AAF663_01755 [Planctomycetota bacterium]